MADGPAVVVDVVLDGPQGLDLRAQGVGVLAGGLLAGQLALHLVQPGVEVVQALAGLAELLLDRLLKRGMEKINNIRETKWRRDFKGYEKRSGQTAD